MIVIDFLLGAIFFASFVVGLLFLRFYVSTGDRFFLYFAASFWIEGFNRLYNAYTDSLYVDRTEMYVVRLIAYGLILIAIWEKNRPRARR